MNALKVICAIILGIITIVPMIFEYKKSKDWFSPITFYNLFTFVTVIPRLLLMEENYYSNQLTDETLARYTFYTALGIICVNIAFFFLSGRIRDVYDGKKYVVDSYENKENKIYSLASIFVMFGIGALSKVYLLIKSGGISYIWENINQRTSLLAGNNYINSLEILMTIACALLLDRYYYFDRKKHKLTLLILILITSFLLLSFGGRSSFVKLVLLLFFVMNYRFKKLELRKIVKLKYLIVFSVLVLIIVMIPMIRSSEFSTIYHSPTLWIKTAIQNIANVFYSISSVDRDMMNYDLFVDKKFWHGKTYAGLVYAWIPRSIFSAKPPVDDGVYLANLIRGFDVEPIMAYKDIPLHSSTPFSSFGIMYSNFGIIGIAVGGIILANVYAFYYRYMKKKGEVGEVLIYGLMMLAFGLSIHSILSLLIPGIIIWLLIGKKPFKIVLGNFGR